MAKDRVPQFYTHVRQQFEDGAKLPKNNFTMIEYRMRQGEKSVKQLAASSLTSIQPSGELMSCQWLQRIVAKKQQKNKNS